MVSSLVVQPLHTGHRLRYVRDICDARPNSQIFAALDHAARGSAEYDEFLVDLVTSGQLTVQYLTLESPTNQFVSAVLDYGARIPDLEDVTFLDTDACLLSVARSARALTRAGAACRAIVMRTPIPALWPPGHARLTMQKSLLVATARIIAPALDLRFLTDAFGVMRRRPGYPMLRPVAEPPDTFPQIDRSVARAQLGIAGDRQVVGIFGALGRTKHMDIVLEAIDGLELTPLTIVAGPYDDWTAQTVARSEARGAQIHAERGLLSADRIGLLLGACNVVVAVSSVDIPSGFTVAAAIAGIPVVTAGAPWLRDIVDTLGIGRSGDLDAADIRRCLSDVLADHRTPSAVRPADDVSFARWVTATPKRRPGRR